MIKPEMTRNVISAGILNLRFSFVNLARKKKAIRHCVEETNIMSRLRGDLNTQNLKRRVKGIFAQYVYNLISFIQGSSPNDSG